MNDLDKFIEKNEVEPVIGGGLTPLPADERDLSFGAIFGTMDTKDLPLEFVIGEPLGIKDQGGSDLCTCYALTAISELQEEVQLSPEFQFAKTKQIMGEYKSWGANLRDALKSITKVGSIPQIDAPYNLKNQNRDFVANWENWNAALDEAAAKHKKESYFTVDGGDDTFDSIRIAIWMNRKEKRGVFTGCMWRPEFTYAYHGIIPKAYGPGKFGHAFAILGWKQINGEPFLIAQLSNGASLGDFGLYYFPREVVNREFVLGNFTLKDMPVETAKYLQENELTIHDVPFTRFWLWLKKIFKF